MIKKVVITLIVIFSINPVFSADVTDQADIADKQIIQVELPTGKTIPFKQDGVEYRNSFFGIFLVLFLLIMAGVVLFYLKKKKMIEFYEISGEKKIRVIETKRISTRSIAFLLDVKGVETLVIQSESHVNTIRLDNDDSAK